MMEKLQYTEFQQIKTIKQRMIHMISDTSTYAKEIIQINYLTLVETLV